MVYKLLFLPSTSLPQRWLLFCRDLKCRGLAATWHTPHRTAQQCLLLSASQPCWVHARDPLASREFTCGLWAFWSILTTWTKSRMCHRAWEVLSSQHVLTSVTTFPAAHRHCYQSTSQGGLLWQTPFFCISSCFLFSFAINLLLAHEDTASVASTCQVSVTLSGIAQESCGCPTPGSVPGQLGWGPEQPGPVGGVPVQGTGVGIGWS